jgi:hypothetical protein
MQYITERWKQTNIMDAADAEDGCDRSIFGFFEETEDGRSKD